jgi:hypothetical protein
MDTRGFSPGDKAARGVNLTTLLQLVRRSRIHGATHAFLHTPSWHSAEWVKHRGNFILYTYPSVFQRSLVVLLPCLCGMLLPASKLRVLLFTPSSVTPINTANGGQKKGQQRSRNNFFITMKAKTKESACRGEVTFSSAVHVIRNIICGPTAIHGPPTAEHSRIDCFRECKLITQVHKI